jgi:hypothetical protein
MFGIDDIVGAFTGGGGGGASSSVSSNVTIQGGDDKHPVVFNETIELKPIELKPITLNENINVGGTDKPLAISEVIDLKPVTVNENIDLKPVTVNENIDLKPITLNENIDLKPVAVDTCQTYKLAPLPETVVRQPYRHHIGYTMFGVEYMGVSYDGESKQLIDSPRRPQVVEHFGHSEHRRPPSTEFAGDRGIRVRVLDPDE